MTKRQKCLQLSLGLLRYAIMIEKEGRPYLECTYLTNYRRLCFKNTHEMRRLANKIAKDALR